MKNKVNGSDALSSCTKMDSDCWLFGGNLMSGTCAHVYKLIDSDDTYIRVYRVAVKGIQPNYHL